MKAPLYLKPAVEGQIVRDPESMRVLAKNGSKVPDTPFWRRRLADRSAVSVEPPAKTVTKPQTTAKPASKPQSSSGSNEESPSKE